MNINNNSSFLIHKKKIDEFYNKRISKPNINDKRYKSKLKESKIIFSNIMDTPSTAESNFTYDNHKVIMTEKDKDNTDNEDDYNPKFSFLQSTYTSFLPVFDTNNAKKLTKEHVTPHNYIKFDFKPKAYSLDELKAEKNKLNRIFQTAIPIHPQSKQIQMNVMYRNGLDKSKFLNLLTSAKVPQTLTYPKYRRNWDKVRLYTKIKPDYIQLFSNFINSQMKALIRMQANNFTKAIKFVKKYIASLFSSIIYLFKDLESFQVADKFSKQYKNPKIYMKPPKVDNIANYFNNTFTFDKDIGNQLEKLHDEHLISKFFIFNLFYSLN